MTRDQARCWMVVLVTTIAFSLALALRERIDPWLSTLTAAGVGIVLAVWALGTKRIKQRFVVDGRGAVVAVAIGAALVVTTHVVFRGVSIVWPELAREVRMLYSTIDSAHTQFGLVLITGAVVLAEELVWRGVATELLDTRRSPVQVGILAVLLYVLPQIAAANPLLVLAALGLGSLFSVQRLLTDRLVDPLLTHAIWSISIFVLVPLA